MRMIFTEWLQRHIDTLKCSSKVAFGQKLAGKGTEEGSFEVKQLIHGSTTVIEYHGSCLGNS